MKRSEDEGVIINVHRTEAQHGIVHAEPCDCQDIIQVGAEEEEALTAIDQFLSALSELHNTVLVGCTDCGSELFVGTGEKESNEGINTVVNQAACPECNGDLVDLTEDECTHDAELESFFDEEELLDDT